MKFWAMAVLATVGLVGQGCRTSADVKQDEKLTQISKNLDTLQKSRADSSVTVEDLRAELLTLRGKIEEQQYKQTQAQAQMDKLVVSIDERLRAIDEKVAHRLDELEKQPVAAPVSKKAAKKVDAPTADGLFHKAVAAYEAAEYKQSAQFFEEFLETKPAVKKDATSRILLGMSYQHTKEFAKAIDTYQTFREKYPKHSREPEIILTQAECFAAMGEKDTSKLFYSEVVEKYPQTVQAKTAKRVIGKMK
jgi:TolA-binding protein